MLKKLGIMGGTFNPIHNGHIRIAEIAQNELALDEVRFIPSGDPPHKQVDVTGRRRLDMVRLATREHPGFTISDIELARVGRTYTCDTLRLIHGREPTSELIFILGGDMLLNITTWKNPDSIMAMARLAVVPRPGDDNIRLRQASEYLRREYNARVDLLAAQGPDISSTEIRAMVCRGEKIGALVPSGVEKYIRENGLYLALETKNDA